MYVFLERGTRETSDLSRVEKHEWDNWGIFAANDTEAHLLKLATEEVAVLAKSVNPLYVAMGSS